MVIKVERLPDYKDLDLDFVAHPANGDISRKVGDEAIKRSVKNLILTNFYDRPFRSFLGSNVQKMLFENVTPLTAINLQDAITEVIRNFEPRVTLLAVIVQVAEDLNGYGVGLRYQINNRLEPTITTLFLERIR